jgi:hypothetical protein
VGLSYSSDYDANGDGIVDKGSGGPSVTVSGSYARHDIEQVTKATIGEGSTSCFAPDAVSR